MELNVSPNYITYISYIMLTDLIMSLTTENYFHWDYFQSFVINVVLFRYGQNKQTHVYRLVTDNSLEKKIYDRQVNKQGMADRIVDEMNPDAHLSTRDVHSLICEEEEDSLEHDMSAHAHNYTDPVMRSVVMEHGEKMTRPPFAHESLLVDRKDNRLSRAEKRLAEKAYKLERTSKITYSRPSYAAFYPKQGTFATNLNNPGSNGYTRNRYYENGKKLETWRAGGGPSSGPSTASTNPYHHVEAAFPIPSFSNVLGAPPAGTAAAGGATSAATAKASDSSDTSSKEWKQREPGGGALTSSSPVSKLQQLVSDSHGQQQPPASSQPPPLIPSNPRVSSDSDSSSDKTSQFSTSQALEVSTSTVITSKYL